MNNYSIDNINERFNNEALRWKNLYKRRNNFFYPYNDKLYRKQYVIEFLNLLKRKNVIDIGCGAGGYFNEILNNSNSLTGLDSSIEMIKICKKIGIEENKLELINSNFLDYETNKNFDCAIAVGFLEYQSNDNDFLHKIKNILSKDGYLIVTLRNKDCMERKYWNFLKRFGIKIDKSSASYRSHNIQKFIDSLENYNLSLEKIKFCHFYPFFWPISIFTKKIDILFGHLMERFFSNKYSVKLASTAVLYIKKNS